MGEFEREACPRYIIFGGILGSWLYVPVQYMSDSILVVQWEPSYLNSLLLVSEVMLDKRLSAEGGG